MNLVRLLLVTTVFLLTSCGTRPIEFRPKIYAHDYISESIIYSYDDDLVEVSCSESGFEDYVSISIDDLVEIAWILKKAQMPRKYKKRTKALVKLLEANTKP